MEPVAEKNPNIATVHPLSKIPTFGSSLSGIRPPTAIPCGLKRNLDKDEVSAILLNTVDHHILSWIPLRKECWFFTVSV